MRRLVCLFRGHRWRYFEDRYDEGVNYTGYLERCTRCGHMVQVPQ